MKRLLLILFLMLPFAASALDFTAVDNMLVKGEDYVLCRTRLEEMLPKAAAGKEKAAVLWRLSRICLIIGQEEQTNDGKRRIHGDGVKYAAEAIKLTPSDPNCYMWHSANVGRECQTHGLKDQISAVPVMLGDLSTILDKLGLTDCAEAWQALAEIYYNHPFKSNDAALAFTRKAADGIPAGELRISTYELLARILLKRGWSAEKRSSEIAKSVAKWKAGSGSNVDRYAFYEGSLGSSFKPVWAGGRTLGAMSDNEEAALIISYAKSLYAKAAVKTKLDRSDYQNLLKLQK